MKLLFLACDGVLRSESSFVRFKKDGLVDPNQLCPKAIALLTHLLKSEPTLRIILTGPEKHLEPKELRQTISQALYDNVIEFTPNLRKATRGDEIRRFLMHTSIRFSRFAVLDCEADLSPLKDEEIVLTDPVTGLTEQDIRLLTKILR